MLIVVFWVYFKSECFGHNASWQSSAFLSINSVFDGRPPLWISSRGMLSDADSSIASFLWHPVAVLRWVLRNISKNVFGSRGIFVQESFKSLILSSVWRCSGCRCMMIPLLPAVLSVPVEDRIGPYSSSRVSFVFFLHQLFWSSLVSTEASFLAWCLTLDIVV